MKQTSIFSFILVLLLIMSLCINTTAMADNTNSILTLEDKVNAMLPAIDSVARAIGVDGEVGYAPRNSQFFWTVIYLMGENWGYLNPLCESIERDGLTFISIPSNVICDMATAAFFDYNELPDMVDSSVIKYDTSSGCYLLAHSDMGDTYTEIESYYEQENGNVSLTLGLYSSTAERLGGFDFILANNQHSDDLSDSQYYYSIMSAGIQP